MDFADKTFLVVGTGIGGLAAVKLLARKQARIVLFDSNTELSYEGIQEKLGQPVER